MAKEKLVHPVYNTNEKQSKKLLIGDKVKCKSKTNNRWYVGWVEYMDGAGDDGGAIGIRHTGTVHMYTTISIPEIPTRLQFLQRTDG